MDETQFLSNQLHWVVFGAVLWWLLVGGTPFLVVKGISFHFFLSNKIKQDVTSEDGVGLEEKLMT